MAFLGQSKLCWWIVLLSFAASLVYSFAFRIHPVVDAKAYDLIAQNLVAGNGFRESSPSAVFDSSYDRQQARYYDTAMLRAGPGYEFFLAGIYAIVGHHYEVVWFLQALLHAATALLVYATVKKLFTENQEAIGLVAAAMIGFWPDLIEISAMLMTETLYLFFTALAVYCFVRAYEDPASYKRAVIVGLVTALGVLTRPTLALFLVVFAVFYFLRKRWRELALLIAISVVVLTPWAARNFVYYHQFIPTTLIGEYNLWVGNTPAANGGQISGGFNPATNFVDSFGVESFKKTAHEAFWSFIFTNPVQFAQLSVTRFVRFFSLIRPMGFWFYQEGVGKWAMVVSSIIWIAIVFALGTIGFASKLKEKNKLFYYLLVLALTSPLPLLLTVVQSRYRFQVYPFLALTAAYAAVSLWQKKLAWKSAVVVVPLIFYAFISIVDIGGSVETILKHFRVD